MRLPIFRDKERRELFVGRMHTCFKTFLIILVDDDEIVRADITFRMTKSKYNVEHVCIIVALALNLNSCQLKLIIRGNTLYQDFFDSNHRLF